MSRRHFLTSHSISTEIYCHLCITGCASIRTRLSNLDTTNDKIKEVLLDHKRFDPIINKGGSCVREIER